MKKTEKKKGQKVRKTDTQKERKKEGKKERKKERNSILYHQHDPALPGTASDISVNGNCLTNHSVFG